jgi:rare lipoprotein A
MYKKLVFVGVFLVVLLSACHRKVAPSKSVRTNPTTETGLASYYADKFEGKPTASGKLYSGSKFTAAHRTIAFGTQVIVTNVSNSKSVTVTINDRGPFVSGRIIDLSKAAAKQIDMLGVGIVKVTIIY